jgi:hypothetical protein
MDNLILYSLIALLIILSFSLYIYYHYFDMSLKLQEVSNEETDIINTEEEAAIIEDTQHLENEEIKLEDEKIELENEEIELENIMQNIDNEIQPVIPSASSFPVVPGSASASPGSASARPGSASASPGSASARPGSASASPGSASASLIAPFTDFTSTESQSADVTVLDTAPTITFRTAPEPTSTIGLMNQDLTDFKNNLNNFFETSNVSHKNNINSSVLKPQPGSIPQIKHLYGDGSYDDFDNVHVYKSQ